jgi:tRNA(fMet)-specific endonuclease VapC
VKLRFLLDTNILSSLITREPDKRIRKKLEQHAPECAIASPVWHELVFGCRRLEAGRRRRAVEAFLREVVQPSFPILPYEEVAAAWHGTERARLEGLGRPVPYVDGQIAAVAHVYGLVLVTRNIKDFKHFEGLEIEDWSKR